MSAEVARGVLSARRATRGNQRSAVAEHGAYRAKAVLAAPLVGHFQSEPVS